MIRSPAPSSATAHKHVTVAEWPTYARSNTSLHSVAGPDDATDDAADANRPVFRHFHFGHMRHVGREDELKSDAAPGPLRQRLPPAGFFRRELEDGFGAGGLVEQSPSIGDRILV